MGGITQQIMGSLGITVGASVLTVVLNGLITLLICWLGAEFALKLADKCISRIPGDKSLHTVLGSAVKVIVYFIIVLIVADSVGINVTSLLAVFSLAGVAVSLALQGLLSNVASSVVLMVTGAFKSGDFVEVNGISGVVDTISLIHTKVTTGDNKVIFIPNSEIAGAKIVNYSAQEKRRVDLAITASYDSSTSQVKAAINKAISRTPAVHSDPEAFVKISNYGESAIEYTIRVWANSADYWDVYFTLLDEIRTAFDEDGVEMTYNHINVHMIEK